MATELNERAYEAARHAVQEHGPKLAPEWQDALAERRHVGKESSRERREAFEQACAAAIEVQNMALAAATAELENARTERGYNPADVDAVLAELDTMVFAAERDALAPPRRLR
ncbi:hypothetical protein [Corynebacterium sp. Marseille-P4321]|uniref:hypothetical protein n=1 Tax=Corynebacterium sp. Marseille-P4321 TaxID=2736603 RepID=UPI00158F013E|nr:hypothetical protein [Corynebacterium sp. Marseille-P4321]